MNSVICILYRDGTIILFLIYSWDRMALRLKGRPISPYKTREKESFFIYSFLLQVDTFHPAFSPTFRRLPKSNFFKLGNRKKSQVAESDECGDTSNFNLPLFSMETAQVCTGENDGKALASSTN